MGVTDSPVRVLLAHDHTLFREAILDMLGEVEGIELVGQVRDPAQAAALAGEEKPDIVLLDVTTGANGTRETLAKLSDASPSSKVVVLIMSEDARVASELLASGVSAYLARKVSRQDLVYALRSTADDEDRVLLSVPRGVMDKLRGNAQEVVSERELTVLLLVARGLSNRQIGAALHLTEGTVKRHLHKVYSKLSVGSRSEAVREALSEGWITSDDITCAGDVPHV